jgi:hypothetical protein
VQTTTTNINTATTTKSTIANKPVSYAFMFCNSPSTKTQYPRRLKLFFDFIGLEGEDLEEQGQAFLDHAKQEGARAWSSQQIMMLLLFSLKLLLLFNSKIYDSPPITH